MALATLRTALLCLLAAFAACSSRSKDARTEQFAALPDWSGIWIAEGENGETLEADISGYADPENGGLVIQPLLGFGPPVDSPYPSISAPYNDAWMPRIEALLATGNNSKARGWGFPTMMQSAAPLQFLITPEETLITNTYRDERHVYTDGRPHLAEEDRWSTLWGDSVGRWEGDTLVIDTVSVKRYSPEQLMTPFPTEVIPVPMLTEQAHYTERLRKSGPDRIEGEITIEDPAALSKPWIVKLVWKRAPGLDRMFPVDFDNDRVEIENGSFVIEPPKK